MGYEFEDVICAIDEADVVALQHGLVSAMANRVALRVAYSLPVTSINPGFRRIHLDRHYDVLVFLAAGGCGDLITLNAVSNWRSSCERAVCVIREVWAEDVSKVRHLLGILDSFDHVFVEYHESVELVQRYTSTPCSFLAPSVDTMLFCPLPRPPTRTIDVYNVGRRSEKDHRPLIEAMQRGEIFYYYTSIQPNRVWGSSEHRLLLANLLKRSRYAIAYPAKFNVPGQTQQELGFRYFEAAAAGAVLVGAAPRTDSYRSLFDWPNAVIDLEGGEVLAKIAQLDKEPELTAKIRRDGAISSLLSHDSVYRWETILDSVGLELLPPGQRRKRALEDLATVVDRHFEAGGA
jgi:hypothetical protein